MELHSHLMDHDLDAYEHVLTHLKEKHIRITETRKAVISYVIKSKCHPSAEQIYRDLLPKFPNMSLATVYNNLKVLIDEGFVVELKLSHSNTTYFDFMGHQHLHVICESCGDILDFIDSNIPMVKKEAQEQTGFEITRAQLMIYGICQDCQTKAKLKAQ